MWILPPRGRSLRMWRSGNIMAPAAPPCGNADHARPRARHRARHGRGATRARSAGGALALAGVGLLAAVLGAGPVRAQTDYAALEAPLLDGSHAQRAYRLVERWVAEAAVPEQADESIEVTGLVAVRVTLRTNGVAAGAAEAWRPDVDAATDAFGPAVDLVPLLQQATRQAFAEVEQSLRDARTRTLSSGLPVGDGRDRSLADVAPSLLVDVQLAHRLETIHIARDARPAAVFDTFAPGYHGLRVPATLGRDPAATTTWPATAVARAILPRSQVNQILAGAGYDPATDIVAIGRPDGPPLQRFRVHHVVRPLPELPPTELVRGNVVLPPHAITGRTLDAMAERLARHLERRFTDRGFVRGTYHPTSNQYDPAVANDEDTALACYALTRHAAYLLPIRPEDEQVLGLARLARGTTVQLGRAVVRNGAPASPAAVALMVLTLIDSPLPQDQDALRDELVQWLLDRRIETGGFRQTPGVDGQPVTQATHALIGAALAAYYEQTRDPQVGATLVEELAALWDTAQADPNVAALPWFVAAHQRAARLLVNDAPTARQRLAEREAGLGDLVERLCEQQVIRPPDLGPADVIGGFELTPGPYGSPPNPDWRTSQLLACLSVALRVDGITEDHDTLGWMLTAGLASRFLAQLMMDEPSCYYVRSLPDTLGGVRLALYDNRLAIAPHAMTLLAVTELQETLAHYAPAVGY